MHFKRHKPKSTRSGCLLCKPYKAFGNSKKFGNLKQLKEQELLKGGEFDFQFSI